MLAVVAVMVAETLSSPALATPSPPIRVRFNGLDRLQAAHLSLDAAPSDTSIAVGADRVLQAANSALRMTARDGSAPIVRSLNDFFGVPDEPLLFQPRVFYDRLAKRFYVAALGVDLESRTSTIHVALTSVFEVADNLDLASVGGDGAWCTYRLDATLRAGTPAFAGSLALGQNESWIVLAADTFRFNNGSFRIATVHVIDKLSLSRFENSVCPTISSTRLVVPRDAHRQRAFALQPAQHFTNHEVAGRRPLYLVASQALLGSSDRYTLWRLEGDSLNRLTLRAARLEGDFVYTQPPSAPQRGGPDYDLGDSRVTQAVFRDGKVWAVHATGCELGSPATPESCLRLLEITPSRAGGEITAQDVVGRPNLYLFAPGVAVNFHGDVLVPFQRAHQRQRLGVGYTVRRAARGAFDTLRNLSGGACPLLPEAGDTVLVGTSAAQAAPLDELDFWIAGEFSGPLPGLGCAWRTRIARVRDADPPRETAVILNRGQTALATNSVETRLVVRGSVPRTGVVGTAGGVLTVALHDAGRPGQTCASPQHPRNGCASVDYPLVEPTLANSNWVLMDLADGPRRFYLTESQDLSLVADPLKPD